MPTELPWVDCGPLGLNGDRPISGSSARDELWDRSSRGVDAVGSSNGSGYSSFARWSASRLLLLGSAAVVQRPTRVVLRRQQVFLADTR